MRTGAKDSAKEGTNLTCKTAARLLLRDHLRQSTFSSFFHRFLSTFGNTTVRHRLTRDSQQLTLKRQLGHQPNCPSNQKVFTVWPSLYKAAQSVFKSPIHPTHYLALTPHIPNSSHCVSGTASGTERGTRNAKQVIPPWNWSHPETELFYHLTRFASPWKYRSRCFKIGTEGPEQIPSSY